MKNMKYYAHFTFLKFSFCTSVFRLCVTFHVTKDNDCALFFFSLARATCALKKLCKSRVVEENGLKARVRGRNGEEKGRRDRDS